MAFLDALPKIDYSLENDGNITKILDIFRFAVVNENNLGSSLSYTYYEIKDGERPDTVSQRLYGTADYYWTFFLLNRFLYDGHCSWPLSQNQLAEHLEKKYSKYAALTVVPYVWYIPNNILRNAPYLQIRDIDGLPLDEKYLPFLYIKKDGASAKIIDVVPSMKQIIIENDGLSDSFFNSSDFYVYLDGDSLLQEEWKSKVIELMKRVLPGRTSYTDISDYYLFTNNVVADFKNAPAYYYDPLDTAKKISAHDALSSKTYNGVIPEKNVYYTTISAAAAEENDKRKRIKVVKKEYMKSFVESWKSAINNNNNG